MRISRRTLRRGIASSVFLSVAALFVLTVMGTRHELIEAWRRISPWALAGGGATIIMVWLAKAARMWIIARTMGSGPDFGRFLVIHLTACFVAHITPFSAGGVPMQVYLVHRAGLPVGSAAALTAVDLGFNSLIVLAILPIVLLVSPYGSSHRFSGWLWWLLGAGAVLILAGLIWRVLRRRRGSMAGWPRLLAWWRRELGFFKTGISAMVRKGVRPVLLVIAATLAYWFFNLLLAPIILIGLGLNVPWGFALGAQMVFNVLQVFLPTPGGSGGSELLLRVVFAPVLKGGNAGIFVFLWKIYTFYATLILGGIFFWRQFLRKNTVDPTAGFSG